MENAWVRLYTYTDLSVSSLFAYMLRSLLNDKACINSLLENISLLLDINEVDCEENNIGLKTNTGLHCSYGLLFNTEYRIQPNYCTVLVGFSKILGKLVVKYEPTYIKGTLKKKDSKRLVKWCLCNVYVVFFFSDFLYKSICSGTRLNCINLSMQFKWVSTAYALIKK